MLEDVQRLRQEKLEALRLDSHEPSTLIFLSLPRSSNNCFKITSSFVLPLLLNCEFLGRYIPHVGKREDNILALSFSKDSIFLVTSVT